MSDIALIVLGLAGMTVAAAAPLAMYALLPQDKLNLIAQHGRFGGLAAREHSGPSGIALLPVGQQLAN